MAKLFIYGLEFDTKLLESQGIEVQQVIDDLFDMEDKINNLKTKDEFSVPIKLPISYGDSTEFKHSYSYNFKDNKYIGYNPIIIHKF